MPDGVNFISDIRPVAGLIGALGQEPSAADQKKLVERLGRRIDKARWALSRLQDETAKIYIETGGGAADPVKFVRKTEAVLVEQKAAAEELQSQIETLTKKFSNQDKALDQSTAKLVDESRDIAVGWLVVVAILLAVLWRFGERAQVETDHKILRAKPVSGEVDHEALSREFMARYPKLRAALAK